MTRDPLAEAAQLYADYVEAVEISSLAELAQLVEEDEQSGWTGAPPVGLVLLG